MNRIWSSEEVFVDTSALVALSDRSDALHQRGVTIQRHLIEVEAALVLSDDVLGEFLGFMSRPPLRAAALATADAFMSSPVVTILPSSRTSFLDALALYRSRRDKEWSLVDCSSIVICRARGIKRVFTHDRHFEPAGFDAMLR